MIAWSSETSEILLTSTRCRYLSSILPFTMKNRKRQKSVIYIYIYIYSPIAGRIESVVFRQCVQALYTMVQYFHAPGYSGRDSFLLCVFCDLTHEGMWTDSFISELFIIYVRHWNSKPKPHELRRSCDYIPNNKCQIFSFFYAHSLPLLPLSTVDAFIQSKASGTLCVQTHHNPMDNNSWTTD
jgi:hypothetical protein